MIDAPTIAELAPAKTAYIHMTIPRRRMPEEFGPAIEELVAAITAQSVEIAGPLFAHHLAMAPDTFDFEAGFPVSGSVVPAGRVQFGERPAIRVIRTVYQGPYEGLPDAWGEFHRWIESQALDWAPDIWECYLQGPESGLDPSEWRTELNRPLKT